VELSYDEDRVLTSYIWEHYRHLFSDFERKVSDRITFEMKTKHTPPEEREERFTRMFGTLDPAVTSALEGGHWTYLRRVRERILAEDPDKVFVNRCPRCQRIVRTPKARQCLWCRHDWHVTV
jgi:hypothetical protein